MREAFTAGAQRVIDRAHEVARRRGVGAVEPVDLLVALADETESRAAALLAEHGLSPADLLAAAPEVAEASTAEAGPDDEGVHLPHSPELRLALSEATMKARSLDRTQAVGTEHLLVALIAASGPAGELLGRAGLDESALLQRITTGVRVEADPLPVPADLPVPVLADPGEVADVARVLDAAANRAREGLRVVEDYVRFVLEDPALNSRLKDVRHRFAEASRAFEDELLITSRDTPGDVGTHVMAFDEGSRENARGVLAANFKRTAEAMRSLEEFTKLSDSWLAGRFEVLRYDVYTLEKRVMAAVAARRGLDEARLYVLVGGLPTLGDLVWVVEEAISGGADVIQYREKGLPDRIVLQRAREVRILTAQAGVRLVMNDRPDLARLAGADGVHLGQDDLSVRDARRVVGPNALIGVSTHEPAQLDAALRDGANYLGVGPVFPSGTKDFDALAGLAYVRHAAESTTVPWFAIGGIGPENVNQVLEAGATRVAVSASVVRAPRPRTAAELLKARLLAAGA